MIRLKIYKILDIFNIGLICMKNEINDYKKNYFENYKINYLEVVKKNCDSLFNEEIASLFCRPPLSSMDSIKIKFIDLARNYNLIISSDILDEMVNKYRNHMVETCYSMNIIRFEYLSDYIDKMINEKKDDNFVIKIYKKTFIDLDKSIIDNFKINIERYFYDDIINKLDLLFIDKNVNIDKYKYKIINNFNNIYCFNLINLISNKISVKNVVLINNSKEINNRYRFTLKNSYIFNLGDEDD